MQGQAIVLNFFFGPTVNAAKAIADRVNAMISMFAQNFYMAVTPQIIKSYAANDIKYMKSLELENNKRAISWVVNNALPLRKVMGGFNVNFIMAIAQQSKINGIANPIEPVYETIRTQIEPLMESRFDDAINVVLMISNKNHTYSNLIVKQDGYLGDVNQIMCVLREIWRYNDFKYTSRIIDFHTVCIVVFLDDNNMYLERHMHSLA
jgi:hypothetical protein